MIVQRPRSRLAVCASINLLLAASGCAALPVPQNANIDVKERQQRTREAVEAFEQKRDLAQFQAALGSWRQGDARAARESLKLLLSRSPNHEKGGVLLAEILLDEQKPQEAHAQIERVLREHPNSAAGHHALAMLLESQRDTQSALKHYREAMKLEPRNQRYKVSYETARAGKPAGESARRAPARLPQPAERAELATYRPNSGARATELEQLLAASRDTQARQLLEKGYKAGAAGATAEALQLFAKAVQREPGNEQLALRASVLSLRWGQPAAAIELLMGAAQRIPRSAAIHRALGTAYYRAADYQAAQASLEQALSLDKSSALAYFLMGCTLRQRGQLEAAEQHFSRAQELDPTLADRP